MRNKMKKLIKDWIMPVIVTIIVGIIAFTIGIIK